MTFSFFKRKPKDRLIKTDQNLAPRFRLAEVLMTTLQNEGYRFLKSKNEFVLDFEHGKKVISLSYNSSMGYISQVDCFIYIVFKDIEKDFKKVLPNYNWTNWTLCRGLYWDSGWLCDKESGQYSDESINRVARKFFKIMKPLIDGQFDKANSYEDLKRLFLSKGENDEFVDWLRPEKKSILKMMLSKSFEPESFNSICKEELEKLSNYKGQDLETVESDINQALNYFESNNKLSNYKC